jgi:hypothetical protein
LNGDSKVNRNKKTCSFELHVFLIQRKVFPI